jgi:hypothetical protein
MKDAPCLSGFTACKPAESWRCQRQAPLRAGRFGAAVRGGPWSGLLRGRLTFHASWVARSALEN